MWGEVGASVHKWVQFLWGPRSGAWAREGLKEGAGLG